MSHIVLLLLPFVLCAFEMLVLQLAVLLLLPSAELLLLWIVVHLLPNDPPIEPLIPRVMIVLVLTRLGFSYSRLMCFSSF